MTDPVVADHDAVRFVHELRRAGIAAPLTSAIDFVAALGVLDPTRPDDVYWAARATLVHRPEDLAAFDETFAAFFLGVFDLLGPEPAPVDLDEDPSPGGAWSPTDALRDRDFATCSDEEMAELVRAVDALRFAPARRRSRRWIPAERSTTLDMRRTLAEARRTDGEVVERRHRRRRTRPRRLVVLVDVSGSMELYARVLIRFAHAASIATRSCEVVTIGTRVTRLSRWMVTWDPDAAIAHAAREVPDWSGGTRLGDGVATFLDEWGQGGAARGAVVVVLSDGLDRGDPEHLAEQMARLRRLAHRILWVNPLAATPGYAPTARGMAAALPYCDDLLEGHSLASLERVAQLVGGAMTSRPRAPGAT